MYQTKNCKIIRIKIKGKLLREILGLFLKEKMIIYQKISIF